MHQQRKRHDYETVSDAVERGPVKAQHYIFFNHRKYGTIRETLLQHITSAIKGHDRIAGWYMTHEISW